MACTARPAPSPSWCAVPHGWQRIQTLGNGKAVVQVSRAMVAKRARLVIRYRGDTHDLPTKREIKLHRRSR